MTALSIAHVGKSFGSLEVLHDVSLDAQEGSLTAILGPSGSGKTTLLRIIAGFERSDRGTVRIGETIVDGDGRYLPPERRRIGYVPQEGALFPHLTVLGNIGFGLPRRERGDRRCNASSPWSDSTGSSAAIRINSPAVNNSASRWRGR